MQWLIQRRRTAFAFLCVLATGCGMETSTGPTSEVALTTQPFLSNRIFGTYCQQDFQTGWSPALPSLGGTNNTCSNFNTNAASSLCPKSFYYNLHGAGWHFEDSGDQENGGGLDGVDMIFVSTHGGAWSSPDEAVLAMYEANSLTSSLNWRLGDENRGLSLFAMHACETLMWTSLNNRWTSAFDGGLRIAVGSADKIWFNSGNTSDGSRFADNMAAGQTIGAAWKNALDAANLSDNAAVVATGANNTDCFNRRDTTKWSNLTSISRLQDWGWSTICQSEWGNL